jgi:hypothetical protein
MEGFLEFLSYFIKASKNSKKNVTILSYTKILKTIRAHTKNADLTFSLSEKISIL